MQKNYGFTERPDKEYFSLTLYDQDSSFLDQLLASLSRQADFEKVTLYEDIKQGVARIKKIKAEQKSNVAFNKNGTGKVKYSLERPPQVFIRRAVDSSEEEEAQSPRGGARRDRGGRRKYKEVPREKAAVRQPVFSSDDFPSLN